MPGPQWQTRTVGGVKNRLAWKVKSLRSLPGAASASTTSPANAPGSPRARPADRDGLLHVFVPHATAGLVLMELGSGSDADLLSVLAELIPADDRWRHAHGSRGHGRSHVLPAFLAPFLVIPVIGGTMALGTWQSVAVVDVNVDNPDRRVRVSFLG